MAHYRLCVVSLIFTIYLRYWCNKWRFNRYPSEHVTTHLVQMLVRSVPFITNDAVSRQICGQEGIGVE